MAQILSSELFLSACGPKALARQGVHKCAGKISLHQNWTKRLNENFF